MYCENNCEIMLDKNSIEIISNFEKNNNEDLIFFKMKNGYIATHLRIKKILYMHQIIMNCYGNGKGTKQISVDHIDQNPLNNCYSNLRIANRKIQKQNTKGIKENTKRARKKSARPLPYGISQEMIPKYVVYYKENRRNSKYGYRDFFRIEAQPKLEKSITSTKSMKKTIFEKLEEIKNKIKDLNIDE